MPFALRYSTDAAPGSTFVILTLSPNPTEVEYPDTREFNARITQDSAVIIQRPLNDSRTRKWSWKNYRRSISAYESQWQILLTLEARQRDLDGKAPIVELWENVTEEGGLGELTDANPPDLTEPSTNIVWTKVKLLQVHRRARSGGGVVTYDDSTIEFIIADPTWENF